MIRRAHPSDGLAGSAKDRIDQQPHDQEHDAAAEEQDGDGAEEALHSTPPYFRFSSTVISHVLRSELPASRQT